MILRGEESWAEARFAESKWSEVDPECEECGGEIDEDGDCVNCGATYLTPDQIKQINAEDKAEYLDQCRRDGE